MHVDYFPTRIQPHRFIFREVQEVGVVSNTSDYRGSSGPGWEGIRVETIKLIKNYICKLFKFTLISFIE